MARNATTRGPKVERNCAGCGRAFLAPAAEVRHGRGRFCGYWCSNGSRRARVDRVCARCGVTFAVVASRAARGGRHFCGVACRRAAEGPLVERFWAKVDRAGTIPGHRPDLGPCWLWTGASVKGCGFIGGGPGRGMLKAHRVAWAIHYGAVPVGRAVRHRCGNRGCVNPAHLTLGETSARGVRPRLPSPSRPAAADGPRAAGRTPLTPQRVLEVRARHACGGATPAALAGEYGVSVSTIYRILRRDVWKQLP
jgi:hypothetical protein